MTAEVDEVRDLLRQALGARSIDGLVQLSGGASRETWSFDADGRPLILQRDRPGGGLRQVPAPVEANLLRAAARAGVPVPALVENGPTWFVVERIDGETIARRILRDDDFAPARQAFAAECGRIAAAVHAIPVADAEGLVEQGLSDLRQRFEAFGRSLPAFELAFRWLAANDPGHGRVGVVHGDFRLGNMIIRPDGIHALLDWEMAHLGDPVEDLGFLCVRSWRFGGPGRVGGIGEADELLDAYAAAGGPVVTPDELRWWEVFGNLRWGVIALQQLETHLSGAQRSVELAAIGRRVFEVEQDVLLLLT